MCQKIPQGDELKLQCKEMGVTDVQLGRGDKSLSGTINEAELQNRWIEAKRAIREANLWKVAIVSMIISIISAATALGALFWRLSGE